jgi:hypothetical protein
LHTLDRSVYGKLARHASLGWKIDGHIRPVTSHSLFLPAFSVDESNLRVKLATNGCSPLIRLLYQE